MVSVSSVATPSWAVGLAQMNDEQLLELMQGTDEASALAKSSVLKDSASIPSALRALYDSRVRLGTNIELWNFMNAVADTVIETGLSCEDCRAQVVSDLTSKPMFELLSVIIVTGELFEEWPGWVRCVLKLASAIIDLAINMRETECDIPGCDCARRQAYLNSVETTESGLTAADIVIRLLKQAWEHHELFIAYDPHSWQYEHLREAPHRLRGKLLYLLESVTRLKQIQSASSPEYARLCFLCWYYDRDTDPEYARRAYSMFGQAKGLLMAASFLNGPGEDLKSFSQTYVQVYLEPERLCRRFYTSILRSKVLSHDIANLGVVITHLLPSTAECISLVLETKLLAALCNCLDLPFTETPTPTENKSDSNVSPIHAGYKFLLRTCLRGIVGIILFVIKDLPFARGTKVLVEGYGIPRILSWIIRLSVYYPTSENNLVALRNAVYVNDMLTGLARDGAIDKKSTLHSTFQEALSREWYPVLALLRKTRTPVVQDLGVIPSWVTLGQAMGLIEDVERKRFDKQAGKRCSLVVCRYYTADSPSTLRTCAGCGEVKYHCKPCQTEDWKFGIGGGHKTRCGKRLK